MSLNRLLTSASGVRLAVALSWRTPEAVGHRLAWWAAGAACRLKPAAYHILRANLGQVLGPAAGKQALDRAARQAIDTTIRSTYDLYRALNEPREKLMARVDLPEASRAVARSLWDAEDGTVVVFPHVGGFDLGGQVLAAHVPEMQLLTLPNPPPGFRVANEFRRQCGVAVTPLSAAALRQAIQLLRRGGVVAVAGDRPVSELDEPVLFFGRPARLPSGAVRLALKTGAAMVVVYCVWVQDARTYTLYVEPPLELVRPRDRDEGVRANMRRVLDALERVIRQWAGQWQMFVPVWPDLVGA